MTVLIAGARLLVNPRFYFADDTQLGSIGIWHELGTMVLSGDFRILDPHAWQGGNYFAEGQWGLLNPIAWLIGIGSTATADVLAYVTVIKIGMLGAFALGVYLLARVYGASGWWAAAAGVIVPAAGFTGYMDAPSWVSGLLNAGAFAFTWWGLRRMQNGRGPLAFLVSAYLLITFGYIFGVIMLVVLLLVALIEAGIRRDWPWVRRLLLASSFGALMTVVVYLPGILTAPVTERGTTQILQAWFLSADLTDVGGIASPTASMSVGAWWGPATHAPMMYISWALPLIVLALPSIRASWRQLVVPLIFAAVALALILGPSHVGPLRWPVRFLPYLAMALIVVWAVGLTRAYPHSLTKRRLWTMLAVTLVLAWLAWTQTPTAALLVITTIVVLAAQSVIFIVGTWKRLGWSSAKRVAAATVIVSVGSVAMLVPQLYEYRYTPLGTFAVPNSTTPMEGVLADGLDDGFVVGDAYDGIFESETFDDRLVGNLWYYSPTSVSNVYTVLPFTNFAADLCIDLRGATCPEAIDTLESVDNETGRTVSELLGINTIVAVKASYPSGMPDLGDSWSLRSEGGSAWVFTRDSPVQTAGGLVATGEGTTATVLEQTDTTVRIRMDEIGRSGRLVLSRLAYPGYAVDGATIADPTRGYLLTVDASTAQPGDVVTVAFRPPGWTLELGALVVALAILVTWPVFVITRRRRSTPSQVGEDRSDRLADRARK